MRYRCLSTFLLLAVFLLAANPATVQAAATIRIVNLDGANEGLNDSSAPDPDSTAGGNPGATLGEQRLRAFQFAADIWENILDSSVEIRVGANFDPLDCDAEAVTLGSAGPETAHRDFDGALETSTWYPAALANKLAERDLAPGSDDIGATFNSLIGTTCPFPRVWYYGLDAIPPADTFDFVTVVLHELGHGLGFLTFVDLVTGAKLMGLDDAFMIHLEDHSTGTHYPDMTDAERQVASIDTGDLHCVGPNVVGASGGLTDGVHPSGHVEMYAPNPPEPGSSVSHFNTDLSPDELMEPMFTSANHDVGLTRELFADIGWFPGADVYFLVDLSGSFSDDLPTFKVEAPTIISTLQDSIPNIRFGLGSYEDYPISPFGSAPDGDVAYRRNIDLTSDSEAVEAVIDGLFTRFGGDAPQSQLPALFQAATGAGQDLSGVGFPGASIPPGQQANFRENAIKIFLLWTDAGFHFPGDPGDIPYPGPSFDETADAINSLGQASVRSTVIGISSGGDGIADLERIGEATGSLAPPGGVDCDDDGNIDIPAGEPLVCSIGFAGEGIASAVIATVQAAVVPSEVPTAIELLSFIAAASPDGAVIVAWETGTEINNSGFNLYRAVAEDGPYTKINDTLIPAEGDAVSGASYSFVDRQGNGTFYYQLEDLNYNGVRTLHGPVAVEVIP